MVTALGLDRLSSRRTTLGWDYEYQRSNATEGLSEDVQRLYMRLEWDVNRRVALEFRGGAFMHSPEVGETETGVIGWIDVEFNQGLTAGPVRFGFNLGVSPSSDDELVGTSLNTTASVVMSARMAVTDALGIATARVTLSRRDLYRDRERTEIGRRSRSCHPAVPS